MQNMYTEPAASSGVPARPSGMLRSSMVIRSGLMPTLISRPSISAVALPSAVASVRRVLMKP
ncbi:hypothetical protein D3C80_1671220 [compost metagenome]